MKRALLILAVIIVHCTLLIDNCVCQWVQQSVPVTSGSFNDMKFVNANTGFIAHGTKVLLRTTNAGNNWESPYYYEMFSLSPIDSILIYATGYRGGYGRIYKTTNSGISWDSLLISNYIYGFLHFFNKDTGIISSGNGTDNQIWRTTDGGQTIQLIQSFGGAAQGKFFFLKEKINGEYYGWMYYPGSFKLRYTTNSGLAWFTHPDFSYNFNSIFFVNKDTGWATTTSYTNYIYMTTNGGVNWVGKYNGLNEVYFDIYFANSQKGWVSGPSFNVCVTTNGGNNWGTQNIQGDYSSKLFFLDSLNGWIKTSLNTISQTTNGGGPITSVITSNIELLSDFKLFQNFPNPFNSSTIISYHLSKSGSVNIKVYDISGKEVVTLVNNIQSSGYYKVTFNSGALSSGIYFYSLSINNEKLQVKKMILNK